MVTDFFSQEGIEFAVIGALALHAYGYTRNTRDIDFITRTTFQARIISYLESLGFKTLHRSQGFSNHVLSIGPTRFDFVYIDGQTAQSVFSRVISKQFSDDIKLPVVCPEHLVALKLHAIKNDPGRKYRELADIKELCDRVVFDGELLKRQVFEPLELGMFYDENVRTLIKDRETENETGSL